MKHKTKAFLADASAVGEATIQIPPTWSEVDENIPENKHRNWVNDIKRSHPMLGCWGFQFDYGEIRSGSVLKPLVVPIRLWWNQKCEYAVQQPNKEYVPIRLWWNQKRYNREVLGGLFSRSNSTMMKSEAIKILPNLRILLRVPIRLWWNQKW